MKKIKVVVLSTDSKEFSDDRIFDLDWCDRFPGSAWLVYLQKLLVDLNIELVSIDTLKKKVEHEKFSDFSSIGIIGEPLCDNSTWLLKEGAIPLITINAESPIYAYNYYDNFKSIVKIYYKNITFSGLFNSPDMKDIETMYFPSFHKKYLSVKMQPWNNRKLMVIVAGNKSGNFEILNKLDKLLKRLLNKNIKSINISPLTQTDLAQNTAKNRFYYIIHQVKYELGKFFSKSFKTALKNELHTKRWEAIKYFGDLETLDLYGAGWDEYERFPSISREMMKKVIPVVYKGQCENKINTIANYKFVFCAENTIYPGYVTEKIIDCFMAGAIPIYIGASDIENFIPKNLFIDLREYRSMKDLEERLINISEEEALLMIVSSKEFLKSKNGDKFSYEYMAERIYNIAKIYNDEI